MVSVKNPKLTFHEFVLLIYTLCSLVTISFQGLQRSSYLMVDNLSSKFVLSSFVLGGNFQTSGFASLDLISNIYCYPCHLQVVSGWGFGGLHP